MGQVVKIGDPGVSPRAKDAAAARSKPPVALIAGILAAIAVVALVVVFVVVRPGAGRSAASDAALAQKSEMEGEADRREVQRVRQGAGTGAPMPGLPR